MQLIIGLTQNMEKLMNSGLNSVEALIRCQAVIGQVQLMRDLMIEFASSF